MFIGKVFIDKYQVEFDGKETIRDREKYLDDVITMMYWKNFKKIQILKLEPIFFIDNVPSKLNHLTFFEEQVILND